MTASSTFCGNGMQNGADEMICIGANFGETLLMLTLRSQRFNDFGDKWYLGVMSHSLVRPTVLCCTHNGGELNP